MFTIFTLLICIVAVAVLLLFLSSLLKGKAQNIIIICITILFFVCVLFCQDWFGPSQEIRNHYSGHYKIDTINLKYPDKIINQNLTLTLTVQKDLTLKTEQSQSRFFKTTTGIWTFESGPDYEVLKYKFDNEGLEEEMYPSNDKWSLRSQDSTHQYISFRRVN